MISVRFSIVVLLSTLFAAGLTAGGVDTDGDGVLNTSDVCCDTPQGIPVDLYGRPIGDLDHDCDVDLEDVWLLQASFTGPLGPPSCCAYSADCETGKYCMSSIGACGVQGACMVVPQRCPDVWDPVCGCDATTYGNECDAAAAGVSVDYAGVCILVCQSNADCTLDEFCSTASCGGLGDCGPRPTLCPLVYIPVCGCDGITYGNECEANKAGVSIDYSGFCVISCQSNIDCAANEYCSTITGSCDGLGECAFRPPACTEIYIPVCGCDGITYGNECKANEAGVSVDHEGVCVAPCVSYADCGVSDYCAKATGSCNESGTCATRPGACPDVYDPVCGCDSVAYQNACYASQAGTSVANGGVCR